MDDLTLVRELEPAAPGPTDSARAAAHARLVSAIDKERRRGVPGTAFAVPALSRRLAFRVAIGATVTAAVAGTTLVATGNGGDGGSGGSARTPRMTTLSAAQVLHRAAQKSRSDSAAMPVPRNDQYLYTKEVTTRTWTEGGRHRNREYTDESWLSVDGSKPSRDVHNGRSRDWPPLAKHHVRWPPTEYSELKKWPTDPDALLALFQRGPDYDMRDQMTYSDLVMLMRGPRVMPPGLQAAAFEAVAKLPDIRIDHDQVDALGRHGIGISYPKMSFGLVFDRDTCAYLGLRQRGIQGQKVVNGDLTRGTRFFEVKGLVRSAVVDRLGELPPAR